MSTPIPGNQAPFPINRGARPERPCSITGASPKPPQGQQPRPRRARPRRHRRRPSTLEGTRRLNLVRAPLFPSPALVRGIHPSTVTTAVRGPFTSPGSRAGTRPGSGSGALIVSRYVAGFDDSRATCDLLRVGSNAQIAASAPNATGDFAYCSGQHVGATGSRVSVSNPWLHPPAGR